MKNLGSKLKPLNHNVIIKRVIQDKKTDSGLFLAESEDKSQIGTIIAVGPGRYNAQGIHIPPTVKVGDKVYLPNYAGIDLGDDYLLFGEDQIIGIFE